MKCEIVKTDIKVLAKMNKIRPIYEIWRPPFCGGPVPMAAMAPIHE